MTAAEKHAGAASPGHRKWLRVSIVQVCQVVRDTASCKGRLQGSSCMHGNVPVQFLGEGVVATPSPYPTVTVQGGAKKGRSIHVSGTTRGDEKERCITQQFALGTGLKFYVGQ
jgi:hypothetical protein